VGIFGGMEFPCLQYGKEVPTQHAVDRDWCGNWQHRQCGTGMVKKITLTVGVKKYLQDCRIFYYLQDAF